MKSELWILIRILFVSNLYISIIITNEFCMNFVTNLSEKEQKNIEKTDWNNICKRYENVS